MTRKLVFTCVVATVLAHVSPAFSLGNKHCDESRASFGSAVRLADHHGNTFCSGVLISDRAVLTAASCFSSDSNASPIKMHIQMQNSTITPCITFSSSTNNCTSRLFTIVRHPNFNPAQRDAAGMQNDAADNIAIAHINSNKLRFENSDIPSEDMARLYSGKWQNSRNQVRTGFGRCRIAGHDVGIGNYREKDVRISHFEDFHYYFKSQRTNYMCIDDRGGPSYLREQTQRRPVLVGIFSDFATTSDVVNETDSEFVKCAVKGAKERFTKISPKVDWISQQLEILFGRGCRDPFQNVDGVKYKLCFD